MGLVLLAACFAEVESEGAATEVAVTGDALLRDTGRVLNIVAHEDDDIGLMTPQLGRTLNSTAVVQTVFLTAGDAGFGCLSYIEGRERGIKESYAQMAGFAKNTNWSETTVSPIVGKTVRKLTLDGTNGRVSLLFLGLPNAELFDPFSLISLWDGSKGAITTNKDTRLPLQSYTRADLIDSLTQIMVAFQPTHLNTLDSTRTFGDQLPDDHPDHIASALFALAAKQRYVPAVSQRMFRAYNVMNEPENFSVEDFAERDAAWFTYWQHDRKICGATEYRNMCDQGETPNNQWCDDTYTVYEWQERRQYTIGVPKNIKGLVRGPGTRQCLSVNNQVVGATVQLASCVPGSANQTWQLRSDDTLRLTNALCAKSGRNAGITLANCNAADPLQRFNLNTVGKLRGPDATCVQASSATLTSRECGDIANQYGFYVQAAGAVYTAAGATAGYADSDVPNRANFDSFQLGDIDGNGAADVCVRRSTGLWCSLAPAPSASLSPAFGAGALRSSSFADANGWSANATGATVQLANVQGTSALEVCGRRSDGIYCAVWGATSFAPYTKRSTGNDFSDATTDYDTKVSMWGSLRFPDVNKDGKADVCGRYANGIQCALNNGAGSFGAATPWITSEFTNALGWDNDTGGATLQYGDIDGDGWVDVCGRGAVSMICAINDKLGHFTQQHLWGSYDDFGDGAYWNWNRSYYGSIRLVDFNGDGKADVCGRGADGVVCTTSIGSIFAQEQQLLAQLPFDDASGWSNERHGATLRFGDLNGDGRQDLCVRGPLPTGGVGLRCAIGVQAP